LKWPLEYKEDNQNNVISIYGLSEAKLFSLKRVETRKKVQAK
jgi:hypothetical protein